MYLCHYVNNQNGPTLLRGGEGGHRGLLNRRTEKKTFKTAKKIR